jgi:hypothetical protein
MSKKETINVQGTEITVIVSRSEDYISLTDMAGYKDELEARVVVSNWMSTRFTLEFLGIWEQIYNPNFNRMEFHTIKNADGRLVLTPKRWRTENPESKGNIRDYATLEQLVVLSNMEMLCKREQSRTCSSYAERSQHSRKKSINALLIRQGLPQGERLVQLNSVAITQMRSLVDNLNLKRLK